MAKKNDIDFIYPAAKKRSKKREEYDYDYSLRGIKDGKNNSTKADLTEFVASDCKISKAMAAKVIDSVCKNISALLDIKNSKNAENAAVTIAGFGMFKAVKRTQPARNYRIKDRNGVVHTGHTPEKEVVSVTFKKY